VRPDQANVYSCTGSIGPSSFAPIAAAADRLKVKSAVIGGEAEVCGSNGMSDFQQLRRELGKPNSARLHYTRSICSIWMVTTFRASLSLTKGAAEAWYWKDAPKALIFVEHIAPQGDETFGKSCKMGLEGLVTKTAVTLATS
jgi:bifunctional non-homologous end joining protein LigD